jgi:uncharacterized damage-inducible protein DinB
MVPRQPWFQRHFAFDFPVTAAPGMVERLRGTPARLENRLAGVSPARLTAPRGERWSIQENAGHLADLEPMWMRRIEDLASGKSYMEGADLENHKTADAHHNARPLPEILTEFRTARTEMVTQLEGADESDWLRSAMHPRLKAPMRLLDLAFFIAEHDDHHLATISELLRFSS